MPAAVGILLGAIYMLYMVRLILFGRGHERTNSHDASTGLSQDLTRREIGVLAPLAALCLFLGVYPKPVIQWMEPSLTPVLHRISNAASGWEEASVASSASTEPDAAALATLGDITPSARLMEGRTGSAGGHR